MPDISKFIIREYHNEGKSYKFCARQFWFQESCVSPPYKHRRVHAPHETAIISLKSPMVSSAATSSMKFSPDKGLMNTRTLRFSSGSVGSDGAPNSSGLVSRWCMSLSNGRRFLRRTRWGVRIIHTTCRPFSKPVLCEDVSSHISLTVLTLLAHKP